VSFRPKGSLTRCSRTQAGVTRFAARSGRQRGACRQRGRKSALDQLRRCFPDEYAQVAISKRDRRLVLSGILLNRSDVVEIDQQLVARDGRASHPVCHEQQSLSTTPRSVRPFKHRSGRKIPTTNKKAVGTFTSQTRCQKSDRRNRLRLRSDQRLPAASGPSKALSHSGIAEKNGD
jgi:hypothetical protein